MVDSNDSSSPRPILNNDNSTTTNNNTNQQNSRNHQQDMLDPYYMHSSDNPGLSIITPHLNNSNYHSQSRYVIVALRLKNKLGFLDGSLPRPSETDRLSLAWDCCNKMVMSWLTNDNDNDISQSILWMDITHEIWTDLHDRYHQGNVFHISDLEE